MKTVLRIFFAGILAAMLWVTWTASLDRGVLQAAPEIIADPWGLATLFDAYFAFLTVWIWIAWREPGRLRPALWLVAILLLGNFAIAGYFLWALQRLGDRPWTDLFRRAGVEAEATGEAAA